MYIWNRYQYEHATVLYNKEFDLIYSTGLSISTRIDNACTYVTPLVKDTRVNSDQTVKQSARSELGEIVVLTLL